MRWVLSIIVILVLSALPVLAQSVQVPEACLNRVSPCLIRTEDAGLDFTQSGFKIHLHKESILRLTFDDKSLNIDVIEGRLVVKSAQKQTFSLHQQPFKGSQIFISRYGSKLTVLNRDDFRLNQYNVSAGAATLPLKSDLVNKSELVSFTKDYFSNATQYKKFLASIESDWKAAFDAENNSQSKVLMRSIASAEASAKERARQKAASADELKKVRAEFFYRTFER